MSLFLSNLMFDYIQVCDTEFIVTMLMIILCPITWNLFARYEFHTKYFTKLAGDNRLAADIFAHVLIEMGIFRNYMFSRTIKSQPHFDLGDYECFTAVISYVLIVIGGGLVFMSFYRLGIHGIYYADYFGILMKEKVTAFPYNILDNPLYVGSESLFIGMSLLHRSPSGFFLTFVAWVMYKFASVLENPLTELIYSEENIKGVNKMNEEREKKKKLAEVENTNTMNKDVNKTENK